MSSVPKGMFRDDRTSQLMTLAAPPGMFRVISSDPEEDGLYHMGDFNTFESARACKTETIAEWESLDGDECSISTWHTIFDDRGRRFGRDGKPLFPDA